MKREPTPISIAVAATLLVLSIVAAISGSYGLTVFALHQQQQAQVELHSREAGAAIRTAIPTCKALAGMDAASKGLTFAPANKAGIFEAEIYSARLSAAIHDLEATTKCAKMLELVHEHVPFPEIARRLGAQGG